MIIEFVVSFSVSAGTPSAVFFSFRLHKGSFDNENFSSDFDIDRVEIDKRNLFFLIISSLAIIPIILSI